MGYYIYKIMPCFADGQSEDIRRMWREYELMDRYDHQKLTHWERKYGLQSSVANEIRTMLRMLGPMSSGEVWQQLESIGLCSWGTFNQVRRRMSVSGLVHIEKRGKVHIYMVPEDAGKSLHSGLFARRSDAILFLDLVRTVTQVHNIGFMHNEERKKEEPQCMAKCEALWKVLVTYSNDNRNCLPSIEDPNSIRWAEGKENVVMDMGLNDWFLLYSNVLRDMEEHLSNLHSMAEVESEKKSLIGSTELVPSRCLNHSIRARG